MKDKVRLHEWHLFNIHRRWHDRTGKEGAENCLLSEPSSSLHSWTNLNYLRQVYVKYGKSFMTIPIQLYITVANELVTHSDTKCQYKLDNN